MTTLSYDWFVALVHLNYMSGFRWNTNPAHVHCRSLVNISTAYTTYMQVCGVYRLHEGSIHYIHAGLRYIQSSWRSHTLHTCRSAVYTGFMKAPCTTYMQVCSLFRIYEGPIHYIHAGLRFILDLWRPRTLHTCRSVVYSGFMKAPYTAYMQVSGLYMIYEGLMCTQFC